MHLLFSTGSSMREVCNYFKSTVPLSDFENGCVCVCECMCGIHDVYLFLLQIFLDMCPWLHELRQFAVSSLDKLPTHNNYCLWGKPWELLHSSQPQCGIKANEPAFGQRTQLLSMTDLGDESLNLIII